MGAHEGEAIGIRECVHRRVACGWGRLLGGRRVLVRVWMHSIFHNLCMCMLHHVAEPGRPPGSGFLHLGIYLTAPSNATCRLGCVRLAHTAAQGSCRASLGSLGISRCGCWAPRAVAPPTHHDAWLTPSHVGAWQRVHRKNDFSHQ
jgi:hypothetical protein